MTGFSPDPVSLAALLIGLGLASFAALMVTSYTKLVIVFGLLRAALGLQQTPPNLVLNGVALILTVYIMTPVGLDVADAVRGRDLFTTPGNSAESVATLLDAAKGPVKAFLIKHTRERERAFFVTTAERVWPEHRARGLQRDDLIVLIPSFSLSEITRAFQIGFVIYMVFVVVDLVVAAVLLAMGMIMLPPTTIALPFKLLLFVMLDGWTRLVQGLVLSYA